MAYAATTVAVMAMSLLVIFGFVRSLTRAIPDDREGEIEIKFGLASIRFRIGPKPSNETESAAPTREMT